VHELRDRLELPGMRVLQFGFDGDPHNLHLPANHPELAVVYTGTHDNDTSRGWWESASAEQRARVAAALAAAGVDEPDPAWAMIRLAFSSRARLAVVPLQDVLGLGNEARINLPGTSENNWSWRFSEEDLTLALAARLREATASAARLAPTPGSSTLGP
jgi:4-alpha-glucanotransferase